MHIIKENNNLVISVIMSNYNTDREMLCQAIDSILNQTYINFEFIIVDDCSCNESLEVLESYKEKDKRIVLIKNKKNLGLTASLNKALQISKGQYIARMDSDDISSLDRLEVQLKYMKAHPDVIVAGSWAQYFGESNILYQPKITSNEEYRIRLLFGNSPTIIHPSAMINKKLLLKSGIMYDENYRNSQDYKMWVDCSKAGNCAIIPSVLLKYRVHKKQVSSSKRKIQNGYMCQIIEEQLHELNIFPSEQELIFHINSIRACEYDEKIIEWFLYLLKQNNICKVYSKNCLQKILAQKIQMLCIKGIDEKEKVDIMSAMSAMSMGNKIQFVMRLIKHKLKY